MSLKDPKKTLALPLHFLKEDKKTNFDIYVSAGGKAVLYCRADDLHLADRIKRLKSKKGLKYFLVLKDHYSSFIEYLGGDLENVFQASDKTLKDQVSDIYFQQRGLLITLAADPTSKEYYSILRSTCSSFYNFFSNNSDALRYFYECSFDIGDFNLWLDHSLRVTALGSRLIADTENDEAGKPVFEVVLGSFLHDLGYVVNEWEIQGGVNPRDAVYRNHPIEGAKLMDHPHVNPWVRAVIMKHEEHIDGSGFPAEVREDEIDPIIQCVAIANAFDRLFTLQKKTFDGALKQLLIDKMGAYPLPLLQKLQAVIKGIS